MTKLVFCRPPCRLASALLGIFSCLWADMRMTHGHERPRLERILTVARSGRDYRPATESELAGCEQLFAHTLRDPAHPGLIVRWQQMGFHFQRLDDAKSPTWIVIEPPRQKRGWGVYLIRPQNLPGLVLQAPHSYADRYTDNVVLRLFQDGSFGAAAWNTVPRSRVDVAHTEQHVFSAFTRALINVYPGCTLVQVHGFAQSNRDSPRGETADLILSNGSRAPHRELRQLAVLLQNGFPYGQVMLFPTEINELGATTNSQAEILRQAGSERFVHLEISQDLRLKLVSDPLPRQVLLKNLDDCVD